MGCYGAQSFGGPMELRGIFKDPPQTQNISGIWTRKAAGENQEPNPKLANPKPADTRPEPDPLPSLCVSFLYPHNNQFDFISCKKDFFK